MCQTPSSKQKTCFVIVAVFAIQVSILVLASQSRFPCKLTLLASTDEALAESSPGKSTVDSPQGLNSKDNFTSKHKTGKQSSTVIGTRDAGSVKGIQAQRLSEISKMAQVKEQQCVHFFNNSITPTEGRQLGVQNIGTPLSDESYLDLTSDCSFFQKSRGYIMSSLTKEEEDFPLAYSLVAYADAEMVERLFRAIYRPQNYYCIHIDQKSSDMFYRAVSAIVQCFPNAFMTSKRIKVEWGYFSVLEPELLCMEELWRYRRWKYFINLTGQEFPLKTNYEIVKILKSYKGAVDVYTTITEALAKRWKNTLPPQGLHPMIGPVHIVVNRYFVDYILHNDTAKSLLEWTKTTEVPDETFFATLNSNPQLGIKGTYKGVPENRTMPFIARYKNWEPLPCAGNYVRQVCILSTGDLPRLGTAVEMFANKFFLNDDRLVIGCLEEKLFNDTRDEYIGTKTFDTTYYAHLNFVKNQVM